MGLLISFVAGLLFGIGLLWSGMSDPAKVLGFLDLFGRWDPSLAFVMIGAIAVALFAFFAMRDRALSLLGAPMRLPSSRQIDRPLVVGSLIFGTGWGIAGFCPGPALVGIGLGEWKAIAFVAAMLVGMVTFEAITTRLAGSPRGA